VALDGVLGSWRHLTDARLTGMPYFRMFMGTDRPWANLGALVAWSAIWAAVAGAAVAAGRLAGRVARHARLLAVVAAVAVAAALVAAHDVVPWYDVFRPLPVAALAVLAWALHRLARTPRGAPRDRGLVLVAAAAAGALALTLKMILFARVWHYGFVLGMPAAMLGVAAISAVARHRCRVAGGSPEVASGVLIGVLAGTIAGYLFVMAPILGARTVSVGAGRDAFRSDSRGVVIDAALAAIEKESPPRATLAVLPDGVMISYLARRPNSTPYVIGNPADLEIFGEAPMLAAYRENPPDLLALTKCDTTIYGFPRGFGSDYARALGAWIAETYEPVGMIGTDEGEDFFRIALLRRKGYSSRRSSSTKEGSGANVNSR
jgi:hypothetical protein